MEFPERQLAVKIQRDEKMLARPFHGRGFGHENAIAGSNVSAKPENFASRNLKTWPGGSSEP